MHSYTKSKVLYILFSNMDCRINITSPVGTYITMISRAFAFGLSVDKVSIYDGELIAVCLFGNNMYVSVNNIANKFVIMLV